MTDENPTDSLSPDWNLLLIASSADSPEITLQSLTGAIRSCGGWVLTKSAAAESCVEIDFEFPRAASVEIYSMLVACGLTLSLEAHLQLTELCQCTKHLILRKAHDVVRLHLAAYTGMSEGLGDLVYAEDHRQAA